MKNIKYTLSIIGFLLISACKQPKPGGIEINGKTLGINTGVCIIEDDEGNAIAGENIGNGRFKITLPTIKAGYYTLKIKNENKSDSIAPCEIYLEAGRYSIETTAGKLFLYPKIKSASIIQNQLSSFYALSDNMKEVLKTKKDSLNRLLSFDEKSLSTDTYRSALEALSDVETKITKSDAAVFKEFVKRYPKNTIGIHLMDNLHYAGDPLNFYPIFKTLPPAERNSERGKTIDSVLRHLVNLVPGVKSPDISGKMPDGKIFNYKEVDGGIILIEFWQANNTRNLSKHLDLIKMLGAVKSTTHFTLLSVASDVNYNIWEKAINGDKTATSFKIIEVDGDGTKNQNNWMFGFLPRYYLIDNKQTIIKDDLYFVDIPKDVENSSKKLLKQ